MERLAYLKSMQGQHSEALDLYQRLGEEFTGQDLVALDPGPGQALREKAEIAGAKGSIDEMTLMGAAEDQVFDRILDFDKASGKQAVPCAEGAGCGTYSMWALDALWRLLNARQASAEDWEAKTLKLEARQEDPKLAASVLWSLGNAFAGIGEQPRAASLKAQALKKDPSAAKGSLWPVGALKNLKKA
jgi:hypothetical protein